MTRAAQMLLALWLLGCGPGTRALAVDLVTDLVPGVELTQARVSISEPPIEMSRAIDAQTDLLSGLRVASFDGALPREVRLTLTVADEVGVVLERDVLVDLSVSRAVTVLLTRSCLDRGCGADESCLGGRCVRPSCATGLEPSCPDPECRVDAECARPMAACAAATCARGSCLAAPIEGTCGPGELCSPDDGCVTNPDQPDLGPRLFLDFDQSPVIDRSAYGSELSCEGVCPPVGGPARIGSAAQLDGTHALRVANSPAVDTPDGFTVAAWVYVSSALAVRGVAVSRPFGADVLNSYALAFDPVAEGAVPLLFMSDGGALVELRGPSAIPLETWVHVAGTWDGVTATLHVDANPVASQDIAPAFDDSDILIGADVDRGGVDFYFFGSIDDVRIYDRKIDPSLLIPP